MPLNHKNRLQRILIARPDADIATVRSMAPALALLPDKEIEARLAKARRRLEKDQAGS